MPGRLTLTKYLIQERRRLPAATGDFNTLLFDVGTIFSVLRAPPGVVAATKEDFLQPGTRQVAAGYAIYGPASMLVLSVGRGVQGFTFDREIGEFILTHPRLQIPATTGEFAINASNER